MKLNEEGIYVEAKEVEQKANQNLENTMLDSLLFKSKIKFENLYTPFLFDQNKYFGGKKNNLFR